MARSRYAHAVDLIQDALRPLLKHRGFRVRRRTFNRITEDGLTQVVNLQMGRSDPPGTTCIPGFRENLHGLFTVNLGVYVPEVARHHSGGEARSWVQEYNCCVRARLGEAVGEKQDIWWPARADETVVDDVRHRLELGGFEFLDRFSTRDKILSEWTERSEGIGCSRAPRIVMAIILAARGQNDRARALLAEQVLEANDPRHTRHVQKLANELGLGDLDGGSTDGIEPSSTRPA